MRECHAKTFRWKEDVLQPLYVSAGLEREEAKLKRAEANQLPHQPLSAEEASFLIRVMRRSYAPGAAVDRETLVYSAVPPDLSYFPIFVPHFHVYEVVSLHMCVTRIP